MKLSKIHEAEALITEHKNIASYLVMARTVHLVTKPCIPGHRSPSQDQVTLGTGYGSMAFFNDPQFKKDIIAAAQAYKDRLEMEILEL